jgi:serine/threonine protein kinase
MSQFDRYQIERQLGRGGFGETFLAKDTRMPTERTVVIKKLKPINQQNIDYQVIKDSFKKEAAVLEELGRNHPNIPELYDYFEDEGEFYLVQEYIEGKTLAEISPISQEQAFSILNSLLRTLQYLQERKLIHRDIKPENIVVRSADGLPVLIDFGAVKDSMGKVRRSSGSVMSSMVIGTRGFMAPEQSEGSPIFSSDLYSLARTMIFALTDKLPNEIEKNMVTGQLDWHKYLPTLDPTLARVLDTASQLSPERRYPTAEEMYRDLHSSQGNSKGQSTAYVHTHTPLARETIRIDISDIIIRFYD